MDEEELSHKMNALKVQAELDVQLAIINRKKAAILALRQKIDKMNSATKSLEEIGERDMMLDIQGKTQREQGRLLLLEKDYETDKKEIDEFMQSANRKVADQ